MPIERSLIREPYAGIHGIQHESIREIVQTEKYKLSKDKKEVVLKELMKLIGEDNVTDNPAILVAMAPYMVALPDIAVRAKTVEHVQGILRVANEHKAAVMPQASAVRGGFRYGGGILLDMSHMNRILEVNTDEAYALIEPGVTIGQLQKACDGKGFYIPKGSYPHTCSVFATYTTLSQDHRGYGGYDECLSFEVVLPDGTLVRTGGSSIPNGSWALTYANFPDIHGLWLQSRGTLGVVTKLAVKIFPKGETRRLHLAGFNDLESAIEFCQCICRTGMVEHQQIWGWKYALLLDHFYKRLVTHEDVGSMGPMDIIYRKTKSPPEGIPYLFVSANVSGYKEVVEASLQALDRVTKELGGRPLQRTEPYTGFWDNLIYYKINCEPHRGTLAMYSLYALAEFGIYVGMGSPKNIIAIEKYFLEKFEDEKDFIFVLAYWHPFDQGRTFFTRFAFVRAGGSKKVMEEDNKFTMGIIDDFLKKYGLVGHKSQRGTLPALLRLGGETFYGYYEVMRRIKNTIDPNNIMNPWAEWFEPEAEEISLLPS